MYTLCEQTVFIQFVQFIVPPLNNLPPYPMVFFDASSHLYDNLPFCPSVHFSVHMSVTISVITEKKPRRVSKAQFNIVATHLFARPGLFP